MKMGPSARKYDIPDADIEHAVEQVVAIKGQDDGRLGSRNPRHADQTQV
jgi:hypothetical protein